MMHDALCVQVSPFGATALLNIQVRSRGDRMRPQNFHEDSRKRTRIRKSLVWVTSRVPRSWMGDFLPWHRRECGDFG